MSEQMTDADMKTQVIEALSGQDGDYSVDGIVDDVQFAHGTVDINALDPAEFWRIVQRHDVS